MKTTKYTTTHIALDTKLVKKIRCLNILELDNDVQIAFSYEKGKRKPHNIVAIHNNMAVNLINGTSKDHIAKCSTLTSDMIINRYKELNLI